MGPETDDGHVVTVVTTLKPHLRLLM